MTLTEKGLYTRGLLAEFFGVKPQTINRWEREGLPTLEIGRQHFYDIDDVIAWLKKVNEERKLSA